MRQVTLGCQIFQTQTWAWLQKEEVATENWRAEDARIHQVNQASMNMRSISSKLQTSNISVWKVLKTVCFPGKCAVHSSDTAACFERVDLNSFSPIKICSRHFLSFLSKQFPCYFVSEWGLLLSRPRPSHALVTLRVWRPGPRPGPRAPPTGEVGVRLRPLASDLYRDVTGDVRGGRAVEIVTLVHLAPRIQVTGFEAFETFYKWENYLS